MHATSDNMLSDLGMTTNDYNTGQTIFYLVFLFAELPSQLLSKWLGPDRWIPVQMVSWSLIAACQAFIQNRAGFLATRAMLGLLEGGLYVLALALPTETTVDIAQHPRHHPLLLILVYIKRTTSPTQLLLRLPTPNFNHRCLPRLRFPPPWHQHPKRLALSLRLRRPHHRVIGVIAAFWMPASSTQTAGLLRGKNGWFSTHEENIMVNRVLREDPSKGDMHNRQPVTPKILWKSLGDYDLWPIYLLGQTFMILSHPATNYISLELKSLGFTTFHTNLFTIPAYVAWILNLLFWTWVSERFNQRLLLGVVARVWVIAALIELEVLPDQASPWARWALISVVLAMPYVHAIVVAITSRNAGTVRTRTVATALYNMSVQISSIVGNNVSCPLSLVCIGSDRC